jgi:SAM-dependent MidA family methyltransferase
MTELEKIISDTINAAPEQKITFAEYMDLVLYHPQYGYYNGDRLKIGSKGDFFTSSSLGPDFGELLAEKFLHMWELLNRPQLFHLVEMGAGSGILAADILNYLQQKHPDFWETLEYIIIEKSSKLISLQQETLANFSCVSWQTWTDLPENFLVGCCFSNELVDAFPVHQIAIANGELQEVYVINGNHGLEEICDCPSTPAIKEYFALVAIDLPSSIYPHNYRTEVNLAALDWLQTVASRLQRGYLLTIDYGYTAAKYYHPQRYVGTLQCYYQHRRHNNPYINIGQQDITTFVDFTALEVQGERFGLQKVSFTQQALFLMSLGLGERLNNLSNGNFNLQQIFARRDALHQLIAPTGLGGFGVLLQEKSQ